MTPPEPTAADRAMAFKILDGTQTREEAVDAVATVFALVRRMRSAQRVYYKTRDRTVLIESKTLEREVDRALDRGTALL